MTIKSDWCVSQDAMYFMIDLMRELVDSKLDIPRNFYRAKKLILKLGLSYDRIYYCVNGCMLFYKNDGDLENCQIVYTCSF